MKRRPAKTDEVVGVVPEISLAVGEWTIEIHGWPERRRAPCSRPTALTGSREDTPEETAVE